MKVILFFVLFCGGCTYYFSTHKYVCVKSHPVEIPARYLCVDNDNIRRCDAYEYREKHIEQVCDKEELR